MRGPRAFGRMLAVVAMAGVADAGPAAAGQDAARQETALVEAVRRGDGQAVAYLLEQGVDVDAAGDDGATALHWAAYLNDEATSAALIRAGARAGAPNSYRVTPLALAARNGNAAIIGQLLAAGVDPNDPRQAVNTGETPLMHAARAGRVAAVRALVEAGADVDAQEGWNGQSALMWAAAEGHVPVVETLIAAGADIRARSNSGADAAPVRHAQGQHGRRARAARGGRRTSTRRAPTAPLPSSSPSSTGTRTSSTSCSRPAQTPTPRAARPGLTVQGMRAQAMPLAIRKLGYSERESEGIVRGNVFGRPLQAAVHVANWHISDQFISVNIDRLRVVRALLEHGADVNGRNSMEEPRWSGARYRRHMTGATAFMLAAKAADVEVLRLLLEYGADPTIDTEDGITPLMAAAGISWASNQDRASEAQVLEAVQMLVEELGLDVNAVNDVGETPMHAAAYRGANSVVQYLFDRGAKLDVVALDGRTPLQVADGVEYGNSFAAHPHTAVLLRELGASEIPCPAPCAAAIPEEALNR